MKSLGDRVTFPPAQGDRGEQVQGKDRQASSLQPRIGFRPKEQRIPIAKHTADQRVEES
jgi:hypothetical protein